MTETIASIGKYRIIEERGRGGFATVYKALDTTLDREVALKVLDPLLTRDHTFIARFQQEARMTARLFHPNIAALLEVGQAEGRYFLAMQYIPGRDLRVRIQERGPLSLDEIASLLQQVGAALDYAHSRGAIHRDVKPSNIIVDENGHATLTDFGIVKALEATTIQTTGGAILGTPSYASPEQVESKPLDGRSDLYSLGVVAYELCAGQVPFEADATPSLYYKIVHEEPALPSKLNARVAAPLEQVLLKAIAKQPDQRYQSGQELAQAFGAAVERIKDELVQSLCEQARALLAKSDLDAAEANLRQVLSIESSHSGAQTLIEQVKQQREFTRRYGELVSMVNQARDLATELSQLAPNLADPEGVLRLLTTDNITQSSQPSTPAGVKPGSVPWPQIVAGILFLPSIIAILTGFSLTRSVNNLAPGTTLRLNWGIFLLVAGAGVGMCSLLLLWFTSRMSHPQTTRPDASD